MNYEAYDRLKARIAPGLRFNQAIYEEAVAALVSEDCVWLDAGCGWHILPLWREGAERALAHRAALAIGCDVDHASLRRHRTLSRLMVSNLGHLPLKAQSVDLITCNMVVEHLEQPSSAFAEFARVLKPGGRVIVHTPNAYSHFVLGSRLIPGRLKPRLVSALDGRERDDVFPTRYRANTPRRLRALMTQAGLREEECRLLASDAVLARTHPWLAALELLYIRLTLRRAFRLLRFTLLATFVKLAGRPEEFSCRETEAVGAGGPKAW